MDKSPQQVIAERSGTLEATAILSDLRAAGWIVVRSDAIKLAQAMEREHCRYEAKQ